MHRGGRCRSGCRPGWPAVHERREQCHLPGLGVLDQVPVVEGDGPLVLHHHRRGATDGADPVGQLLGIRHRCRQTHEADGGGEVDDDLLPHRTAVRVLEVVDLVEHHPLEALQRRGPAVDHVAQHLGGHHDDLGVAVDRRVAGEQPDPVGPVEADEVVVLLVRQGLDRRRVEGPAAGGQGHRHRVLGHHRLPRPGGRADEHRTTGVDGLDGLELEAVEGEAPVGGVGHWTQARAGPSPVRQEARRGGTVSRRRRSPRPLPPPSCADRGHGASAPRRPPRSTGRRAPASGWRGRSWRWDHHSG